MEGDLKAAGRRRSELPIVCRDGHIGSEVICDLGNFLVHCTVDHTIERGLMQRHSECSSANHRHCPHLTHSKQASAPFAYLLISVTTCD